jgi:hypothetical protein
MLLTSTITDVMGSPAAELIRIARQSFRVGMTERDWFPICHAAPRSHARWANTHRRCYTGVPTSAKRSRNSANAKMYGSGPGSVDPGASSIRTIRPANSVNSAGRILRGRVSQ